MVIEPKDTNGHLRDVEDLLVTARAIMNDNVPKSREASLVITKIDEAELWLLRLVAS